MRKTIVLIQGTFDILNYGHIRAFELAKAQGDHLIVALNTNDLIRNYKGREPVMPWHQKKLIIEAIRHVDQVIPAPDFSPMGLLVQYDVDVYMVSPEWRDTKWDEIAYMEAKGGKVVFTRRFTGISTSVIKERLLKEHLSEIQGGKVNDNLSGEEQRKTALPVWKGQSGANGAGVLP